MSDLDINSLTEDQKLAVQTESQFLFVSAGPGSGKTRVLTIRVFEKLVKKLLLEPPSKTKFPTNFVITFTNKAAKELNQRINLLIDKHLNPISNSVKANHLQDPRLSKLFVGTFHALGLKILSTFSNVLYKQKLSIIAKNDCTQLFKLAVDRSKLSKKTKDKKSDSSTKETNEENQKEPEAKFDSDTFFNILKIFKQTSNNHNKLVENIYDLYNNARYIKIAKQYMGENKIKSNKDDIPIETLSEMYYKVYLEYISLMQGGRFMDFDDLLQYSIHTLCHLGPRHDLSIDNIYVDEFQDTNELQLEMLVKMRNYALKNFGNPTVTLVGDQDQTIFSWRNYTLETAESDSPDDIFQNLNGSSWKKIRLEKNFRSTDKIILAANNVIQFDTSRKVRSNFSNQPKAIEVDGNEKININQPTGPLVVMHSEDDEYSEGKFIVKQIKSMRDKAKKFNVDFKLSDIAILTRAVFLSDPVIASLNKEGIPYKGIGKSIWESKFVLDLLAYIKVLYNPNDLTSLQRSCNTPARGLGPAAMNALAALNHEEESLVDYILKIGKIDKPNKATNLTAEERKLVCKSGFKKYVKILRELVNAYNNEKSTLLDFVGAVAEISGLKDSLKEEEKAKKDDDESDNVYVQMQQLIVQIMEDGGTFSLKEMVKLLIEASGLNMDGFESRTRDAVNVLTIHSAKGLEWPIVFIVAVQDGCIPFFRAKEQDKINEEIRLLYVGITRCKFLLYLTSAYNRQHGSYSFNPKCYQYLKDLNDYCRTISPPFFTAKFFNEFQRFLNLTPTASAQVHTEFDDNELEIVSDTDHSNVKNWSNKQATPHIEIPNYVKKDAKSIDQKDFTSSFQSALSMMNGNKPIDSKDITKFSPYVPPVPRNNEIIDLTDSPKITNPADSELLNKFQNSKKFKSNITKIK